MGRQTIQPSKNNTVLNMKARLAAFLARKSRKSLIFIAGLLLFVPLQSLAASNVDLSVSAYTWTPDPVVRGGTSTFSVTVTNNDVSGTADTLSLVMQLPTNVDFAGQAAPANCVFDLVANPKTLTCTKATLGPLATWVVDFTGNGLANGVQNSTVTVSSSTNTDPNAGNDALTKNITVINGADLTIVKTGQGGCVTATPCTTTAGSSYSFTLRVTNNGPDQASAFRVTDNLPAGIDFTYQSATGTGWSCGLSGTTVTCDYSGAAVASGVSAPDITLTGTVITSAGTITNGASVVSTDGTTADPVAGNNGPSQVVVSVSPGTSLRANKTMVSAATGMTSYAEGEAVTLTLSATNQGPQNATDVAVTDTVPTDFSIGVLPGGCAAVGQAITCTVGALASGATSSSFVIPLTVVGTGGTNGTNTANVTRSGPAGGANTAASVNYSISAPFAHLTIAKTKGPNPVAAGQNITNTITVSNANSSTSAATGTIRVTDVLDANENFVSYAGAGWSCSGVLAGATGTVTCDYAGANLARGASLPVLTITTQAANGFLGTITNTACTGLSAASPHTPADNAVTGNCQARSVTGTNRNVDLSIAKVASIPSPTHMLTTDNSLAYTLTVTNDPGASDTAPTVTVTDVLPAWYSGGAGTTSGSAVLAGQGAGESCIFGTTVSCTILNLAPGASRTITVTVDRPLRDGSFTNTATVSTPDAIDSNAANNSASANIIIDPIADVAITDMASAPSPVKVGVQLTYTTSIKNNGPSTAAGVVLRQPIDAARMTYVAASASLTGSGGSCGYTTFVGAPFNGQTGIECTGFTLTNGESRQLTYKVVPVYPYPDAIPATYTTNAYITTTTVESDAPGYANNGSSNNASVTLQALDLAVTDNDAGYDPTAFGNAIVYQVKAQNNGPSQATGFMLTVVTVPPAQGTAPAPYTMTYNGGLSTLPGGASCSQPGGANTNVVCYLGANRGDQANVLAANASATFNLAFDTAPLSNKPSGSVTYATTPTVASYETDAGFDLLPANNTVTETTTVLPKTDLILVSKTVSQPVVDINEPFSYTITVGNKGPSDVAALKLTDVLPAGFEIVPAGTVTVTKGSGVAALTSSTCTPSKVGNVTTVSCTLGSIPTDATGVDPNLQVQVNIPVRAAYQSSGTYAFAFNTNIPNTATVGVVPGTSLDPDNTNDSQTVNVQVRKNSIAGYVYSDADMSGTMSGTGSEGIGNVTLTLTGTDSYGYTYNNSGGTYAALTTTTSNTAGVNKGSFLFDKLPPGTWTVVETQPATYWDYFETAGTAGGTVPAATCNGTINCASSPVANTISGITLNAAVSTAATGYLFAEYPSANFSGKVFIDENYDGTPNGADVGLSGVTLTVTGSTYNGTALSGFTTTNASGNYTFTPLAPGDANGYSVTITRPAGYFAGKTTAGTVSGPNAVAGTVLGGVVGDTITGIKVYAAGSSPNNNFAELQPRTISGYVFLDANTNAARDLPADASGLQSVTLTLAGTDDLGAAVNATTSSGANGGYSFTNLRPGTYTVTETPPLGLTHTGAQAGSQGATIAAAPRAAGVAVTGASVTALTVTLPTDVSASSSLRSATDNNFGESGQGLSGYVYADFDNNGIKDAGEPGLAGIQVSLSGHAANALDVCVVISPNPCTVSSDANGAYHFYNLPASDATGYTLTEQPQAAAPLSYYGDGLDTAGTLGGTVGNDVLSGIHLNLGQVGVSYNFGERAGSISGSVYADVNNNGSKDAGDAPMAGVTVTLSGTTAAGVNVCAVAGVTCVASTDASGNFSYTGLPASNGGGYTVTETQPVDYADGSNAAGTSGGTVGVNVISAIVLTSGTQATAYTFGEKTGAIAGFVYHDANNNGVKNPTETGIGGTTLTLTGTTLSGAAVSVTTTTAADGSYSFAGLRYANATGYTVTETQPAGYLDGKLSKGLVNGAACANPNCDLSVANVMSNIPFDPAKTFTAFNFGELRAGAIAGRVYADTTNNSTYESGEELAGVTITLTGKDDLNANVSRTVTTAADGTYVVSDLRPSDAAGYTVTETQPAGLADYSGTSGTFVGTLGGVAGLNVVSGIVMPSGGYGASYDFRENISSLSGTVYRDDNDNGKQDATEPGIAKVTIALTGTDAGGHAVNRTTQTDDTGNYAFAGVIGGNYTLTETQPAGFVDGRETAGTLGGTVDGSAFDATPAHNSISQIVLTGGQSASGYLFGERGGSLSGFVYVDANDNGAKDASEPGIPKVRVTLSGQTESGLDICTLRPCTLTTDANGAFNFDGVPPGAYKLAENHGDVSLIADASGALLYADGKETAGVAGGSVNNAYFGSQPVYNTIDAIAMTSAVFSANAGNISGYLFGERLRTGQTHLLKPPILSGYVYLDRPHTRVRAGGSEGQPGWTVTLKTSDGTAICTVQTDATGFYQFDNLHCPGFESGLPTSAGLGGKTFSIFFSFAGSTLTNTATSGGDAGLAGAAQITGITLNAGDEITEQNLPLDPAGVVYDAVSRKPIAGATVVIAGPPGFNPVVHLDGGSATQVTGSDGMYSFLLQNNYPSGTYTLTVTAPGGYLPAPSVMIPPCANTLQVGATPSPALVQQSDKAPATSARQHAPNACEGLVAGGSATTQYYFGLGIQNGVSASLVNNHIPLDPTLPGSAILLVKTSPLVSVTRGQLVPYTITATNISTGALANVDVIDQMPAGFRYRSGSASANGVAAEPVVSGRLLTWRNLRFATGEKKVIKLLLVPGMGVGEGEFVNNAWTSNNVVNTVTSNLAAATVRLVPDGDFDCTDLIGKAFDDKNANGYQDQGERGLPNVRLATANGLLITTDAEGRFHIACAAVPQADHGSNFVLKLDERTLPSGYRLTTENPGVVRLTRGKMTKLNFGATVHRVVRLELADAAFEPGSAALKAEWRTQLDALPATLGARPSVLRIAYARSKEDAHLAQRRIDAVAERIKTLWHAKPDKEGGSRPPLLIETELEAQP